MVVAEVVVAVADIMVVPCEVEDSAAVLVVVSGIAQFLAAINKFVIWLRTATVETLAAPLSTVLI